jgi:hypothetical protein
VSFVPNEFGFESNVIHMKVRADYSNAEMGHMVTIDTPRGQVQVYASPKGHRTRIFLGSQELTA